MGKYNTKLIFKYDIGERIVYDDTDITITERNNSEDKYGWVKKTYKYKCNKCGFDCGEHYLKGEYKKEYWIRESRLNEHRKCLCCSNQITVENINSIYKTDNWMTPYIGEECAKTHTHSSGNKVQVTCPDCGRIKDKKMSIHTIYTNHSINCTCSDKVSYGEKLMCAILEQFKAKFKTQLNKTTFEWCDKYRYDFYFKHNDEHYICEIHGKQHYEDTSGVFVKTLGDEKKNDKLKKELAIKNGIKPENYIVIDCRYSTLEWIKNNENGILNSKLNDLFDINQIDWIKASEFACSNLVKKACEYKRDNPNMFARDIGIIMGYDVTTIIRWLKKGNNIWGYYNGKEEIKRSNTEQARKNKINLIKPIKNIETGLIFESASECARQSLKVFGVKLNQSNISMVCLGKKVNYKKLRFSYIPFEEYKKYLNKTT